MKVSIITVTYNSGRTLSDTLESVLRQTYTDIELVVVDGLSTDNTMEVVRQYEPKFGERMRYISEKDQGLYDAMNKGISMATGDVVGILNSDDYFSADDVIERVVQAFQQDEKTDAIYGDVHFIHDGEPDKCVRYYSSALFRPWLLRFGFMPAHPSFYARKRVYEKYGLYSLDYKIAADYEMMVRLFYKHKIGARYVKMDFVTMRIGGISTRNIHSRLQISKEDVVACKRNGLYTNIVFICVKYFAKVFEFKWWKL